MAEQMLRLPDVIRRTGLSRNTIWRLVRKREFPAPLQLSDNAIGWPSEMVESWLESRPRRTYGVNTADTVKASP